MDKERTTRQAEHPKTVDVQEFRRRTILEGKKIFRRQLRSVLDLKGDREQEEMETACERSFLVRYLQNNVDTFELMESMSELIDAWEELAPVMFVDKCIDGRVHGSKGKGWPKKTKRVRFHRTEGGKLDLSEDNKIFWSKIDTAVNDAKTNTDQPMLFKALAHTAEHHGCAAQTVPGLTPEEIIHNSLETVKKHAEAVRARHGKNVFAVHGITNTDDMSESFTFENGTTLSSSEVSSRLDLKNPEDVFSPDFLDAQISDPLILKYANAQTVRELISGDSPSMYTNLQSATAMEVYLMRNISAGKTSIMNPAVYQAIDEALTQAGNVPPKLRPTLIYNTMWNIAYSLYQKKKNKILAAERPDLLAEKLEHNEDLICYGEGFELLDRNKAVLAKTGRGDDKEALTIAKKVLSNNRKKREEAGHPQSHRPVVHINIELANHVTTWSQLNKDVLDKLQKMTKTVKEVFEQDPKEPVCIMTTYSYEDEKCFYPVQSFPEKDRDPELASSFEADLGVGLTDMKGFAKELHRREGAYSEDFASAL